MNALLGIVFNLLLALGQFAVLGNDDLIAGEGSHFAGFVGDDDRTRVTGDALLETGGDQRRFGDQQRHRLALHVGTHQRAVRVVVLQERDQAGRDGDQLLGRDIHVIDPGRLDIDVITFASPPANNTVGRELALVINRRVRLGNDERFLAISGKVIEMPGHAAVFGFAIRRFQETKIVDAGERRQRRDQTDVRTFRRFHRTDTAIVRIMHVADLKPGTIARKPAWPQGRQPALMRQLRQRVDLIHEL